VNGKDKQAFVDWYKNKLSEFDNCKEAWQAALEYERGVEDRRYHDGLQDGITKERERSKILFQALKSIVKETFEYQIKLIVIEALAEYDLKKEKSKPLVLSEVTEDELKGLPED
jgi:hypothetical protein